MEEVFAKGPVTTIGVLALQGAFIEHIATLRQLGVATREVRLPEQMSGIDGLIIPGGESTTIGKLMVAYGFLGEIRRLAEDGLPLFGTCAGMIMMAKDTVQGYDQPLLGLMDIVVHRNGFGRQVDSFEVDLSIPTLGEATFPAIFIRAPYIQDTGGSVSVLSQIPKGPVVCARQGKMLVSAFHPELTDDPRLHQYFLEIAMGR